ncbi:hypothetical protein MMRN_34090 [Mycobacterium marinum]|nr:hypothetical protein MMRN_34090 [Mycobacterium marinum]
MWSSKVRAGAWGWVATMLVKAAGIEIAAVVVGAVRWGGCPRCVVGVFGVGEEVEVVQGWLGWVVKACRVWCRRVARVLMVVGL